MPATKHERPYGLDAPCEASPAELALGIRHLVHVGMTLVALVATTYVVPPLARFRPWVPGDPTPVLSLFDDDEEGRVDVAVATGGAHGSTSGGPADDALAPILDDGTGGERSEGSEAPIATPIGQRVRVAPSEIEGVTQQIEDPSGAMNAFYESLKRTALAGASGDTNAMTRVAHYGDSSIAADGITDTLRERLQTRFGDGGHGFVLTAKGSLPYRHRGVRTRSSDGWRLMDITHLPLSDGRYGYGGYQARSVSGAEASYETMDEGNVGRAVSRFDVLYQRHPRGGRFQVRVDDGEPTVVDTRGETADEVHRVEVPDGPHELEIRTVGHGENQLYGVVLERAGPGVVYDSLGMVGARARRFLGFDLEHLRRQLELRQTNLVVIGYGGNDADDDRDEAAFEDDFRQVARLVRQARPQASCLLFAPLDQAERDERGRIVTLEPVPRIVSAMRRAALAEGCAFFDTYEAMGGQGAMGRWFRQSPRLAFGDFRHATPAGYRVIGTMLYRAMLAGFARYVEAHP